MENAQLHQGKNYVANIDLKDFFGSIDSRKIQDLFTGFPFSFNSEICELLYKIVVHDNKLPIGAATSPVIANFLLVNLDYKFNALASKYNGVYSRYVDDITFSFDTYPNSEFLREVMLSLSKEGYEIAWDKFKIRGKNQRQEVTGLTVNVLPNIKSDYYKKLRATIHNLLFKDFNEEVDKYVSDNIYAYRRSIHYYWRTYYSKKYAEVELSDNAFSILYKSDSGKAWYTFKSIEGKLSYVKRVLGDQHPKYRKLLHIRSLYENNKIPKPEVSPEVVYVTNAVSKSIVYYAYSYLKYADLDNDKINVLKSKLGFGQHLKWTDLFDSFTKQNIYFLDLYKFILDTKGFECLSPNNSIVKDWETLKVNLNLGLYRRKVFHVSEDCESLRSDFNEDVFHHNTGIFAKEETAKYNKPYLLERSYLEKLGMRVCKNCGGEGTVFEMVDAADIFE